LSIAELQKWMGAPSLYVYDCSNAGKIVESFLQYAKTLDEDYKEVTCLSYIAVICQKLSWFSWNE
jgi:regulator-associated protein of mTOR